MCWFRFWQNWSPDMDNQNSFCLISFTSCISVPSQLLARVFWSQTLAPMKGGSNACSTSYYAYIRCHEIYKNSQLHNNRQRLKRYYKYVILVTYIYILCNVAATFTLFFPPPPKTTTWWVNLNCMLYFKPYAVNII